MGIYGDGKLKEGKVFLDQNTKELISQVKDPKILREIEKTIIAKQNISKD